MVSIYVMRDDTITVVSRHRPRPLGVPLRIRLFGAEPVRRSWRGLAELPCRFGSGRGETALVFAPPAAIGVLAAAFAPVEVGVAAGGVARVASTYFTPRRVVGRSPGRLPTARN